MVDEIGETSQEQTTGSSESKVEPVPLSLREFGEVPEGYVSVFIQVSRRKMERCAKNGLRVEDNPMKKLRPELERIFAEEKTNADEGVDRTKCIFAYPRTPDKVSYGLRFDPENNVLLEAKIDPKTAKVANGEYYTEAGQALNGIGGESYARDWAKSYWEEAKPLTQYLAEGHDGSEEDYSDFTFPEVLIPEDIPTSRLRVAEFQPAND